MIDYGPFKLIYKCVNIDGMYTKNLRTVGVKNFYAFLWYKILLFMSLINANRVQMHATHVLVLISAL